MRNAFTEAICERAQRDERLIFLVADIGNITFDNFRQEFPHRFLNVGVAEANMVGVSAGLALSGKIPVVYTIASFEIFRAFEQIRDDVCYQNLPVKIVGVGCGLAYSTLGPTHHTLEDIAVLRALPNLTIVCPADPVEARLLSLAAIERDGPVFVRLAKAGEPRIFPETHRVEIGKAVTVADGEDVAMVATGLMVGASLRAAESLRVEGIQARVLNMHTIKPLDRDAVLTAARETGAVVTVEEHSTYGGLGGAVAEVLAEEAARTRFLRLGLPDRFCSLYGSHEALLDEAGLSPDKIARSITGLLRHAGR